MEKTKRFSKAHWLVSARADMDAGVLTQQDIDNACKTWVDDLDGKTVAQIEAKGDKSLLTREEWFV